MQRLAEREQAPVAAPFPAGKIGFSLGAAKPAAKPVSFAFGAAKPDAPVKFSFGMKPRR